MKSFVLRIPSVLAVELDKDSTISDQSINHRILEILAKHYSVVIDAPHRAKKKPRREKPT